MNREQKAAAIAEIAEQIQGADAVFAVDYRGISVPQAAELRTKLRDADAKFQIVKNSLTERAADQAGDGAEHLKPLLEGPTALTFVRGDVALAAKAIADYGRATDLLAFKGGIMGAEPLEPDQIKAIAKLPSREVLYGQLVGVVASPITGVVRTLNALIQGLALQLGQIAEKKQSGEIPAGDAPAPAEEPAAEAAPAEEPAAEEPAAEEPAAEEPAAEEPAAEAAPAEEPATEAETDDNQDQADASTEADEPAEAKED